MSQKSHVLKLLITKPGLPVFPNIHYLIWILTAIRIHKSTSLLSSMWKKCVTVIFNLRTQKKNCKKVHAIMLTSRAKTVRSMHIAWSGNIIIVNKIVWTIIFPPIYKYKGAHGDMVGWGTALQARRSQIWFPMMSLEFFIDIILLDAIWPWGQLGL